MDKIRKSLIIIAIAPIILSLILPTSPLYGFSTVFSTTILGTTMLGTTTTTTTIILGSISISSIYIQAYIAAYSFAIYITQILISLAAIGIFLYIELTNPEYGKVRKIFSEIRKTYLPLAIIILGIFILIVITKIIPIF